MAGCDGQERLAHEIVAEINRQRSARYRLGPRPRGGVNATWFVDGINDDRALLKINAGSLSELSTTASVVDMLRTRGYPTPPWRFVGQADSGDTYEVQEFASGELPPPTGYRPSTSMGCQLVELVESNAGYDPRPDRDVSAMVVSDFTAKLAGLRQVAPEIRRVVDRYEELHDRLGITELPVGEFVHADLHFANILSLDDRVTAVVDIEGCGSGTRAIDYGILLRDTYFGASGNPTLRSMIRSAGEAVAGPGILAFCAAASAIGNLHWRVHERPVKIPRMLPGFERLAIDLQEMCGA